VADVVTQASTGRIEMRVSTLRSPELARDYLARSTALAPFFAGHPHDPAAYRRKADEVAARFTPAERRLAGQAIRATSSAGAERLDRILDGEGFFVTTGQQVGLFSGPLYTAWKTLSAVRLARELENLLGCPIAPLFWVAADDHDWAEVDHTFVMTPQNELRRIELPDDPAVPPHPMSHRLLPAEVDGVLQEFTRLLPDSEFAPALRALLAQAYRPGRPMAKAFEDLLAGLFSEFDLLVVNSAAPAVKRQAAPILRHELERAEPHAALLKQQSERLVSLGYHAQVTISEDAANVLIHDDHGRDRLVREDGVWMLRRSRRTLTDEELLGRLEASPEAFSPNVLLRPVVESAVFPTIAYVAGPSELSYFAQIGCLFTAHGLQPPVVFPRFRVTLVESKVRKVMDKFDMDLDAFMRPFQEVTAQLVRDEMPDEVIRSLDALRASVRAGYDLLGAAAAEVDPTLLGWLEGLRNQALAQTESAEKKIASHLKKKNEVELEQLRKAAANLYPDGSPQERVLNALPYLARYGMELLHQVLNALPLEVARAAPEWTGVRC
jgi:bacillithiol biosynthesis cysteine-adding enzyme BshC